mgnify:CR=1 FL=1
MTTCWSAHSFTETPITRLLIIGAKAIFILITESDSLEGWKTENGKWKSPESQPRSPADQPIFYWREASELGLVSGSEMSQAL